MRSGKWKLRLDPKQGPELFDLEADISEANNLADKHPEIVARLKNLMAEFDNKLKANSRPAGQGKR